MRMDCRFYESRTYAEGETVRMCRLDLAPEAPWRCPENCPAYERKVSGGGWTSGSLGTQPTPEEPPNLDEHSAQLLDNAEDIINMAGPEIIAEVERERAERESRPAKRKWWPFSGR
jgi:hypothetical protein